MKVPFSPNFLNIFGAFCIGVTVLIFTHNLAWSIFAWVVSAMIMIELTGKKQ